MRDSERVVGGASFSFQLLLLGSLGWGIVWVLLTVGLLVFKATALPFPPAALPMEIVACVLAVIVNSVGCITAIRGNLTEEGTTIFMGLFLIIVAGVGALYYMWLQTYVLRLDLFFSAIFLAINCLTLLLGIRGGIRANQLSQPHDSSRRQREQSKKNK